MDTKSSKLFSTLSNLNISLDELEAKLEPLFAQSLPESVVGLDNLQQAKLQVAVPYIVYDLVFIYLKTRGIDPKTHPVVEELEGRIKQYFEKIKNAESSDKRRPALDRGAANRFIKHAIAQVKYGRPPGDAEGSTSEDVRVPMKVTSKMSARAEYEEELKEMGSEEEDELEVFDNEADAMEVELEEAVPDKGKGKERLVEQNNEGLDCPAAVRKRKRPAIDPFAGFGDEPVSADNFPSDRYDKTGGERSQVESPSTGASAAPSSGHATPVSLPGSGENLKKNRKSGTKARKKGKNAGLVP